MLGDKGSVEILYEKKCKKCGKTFTGTSKDKKCERCKNVDADSVKKGVGIAAASLVLVGAVAKGIAKLIKK